MFTILSGFYVLDKEMPVSSRAEEDSGSKHSTDTGFLSLVGISSRECSLLAEVSAEIWQEVCSMWDFGKQIL